MHPIAEIVKVFRFMCSWIVSQSVEEPGIQRNPKSDLDFTPINSSSTPHPLHLFSDVRRRDRQ